MSLRPKDLIATFNWDPFLMQALARNYRRALGPQVVFLHGNTAIGYCFEHEPPTLGQRGARCGRCGKRLEESRLLYPVAQKNYSDARSIQKSWDILRDYLKDADLLTIFGYGAPASDVEAVALMKEAWGDSAQRELEEVEIIDVKSEDELTRTWDPFIHSHHVQTHKSFYHSIIGKHPRRSCDAMWSMLMNVQFIDENRLPKSAGWDELLAWYQPLLEDEHAYAARSQSS